MFGKGNASDSCFRGQRSFCFVWVVMIAALRLFPRPVTSQRRQKHTSASLHSSGSSVNGLSIFLFVCVYPSLISSTLLPLSAFLLLLPFCFPYQAYLSVYPSVSLSSSDISFISISLILGYDMLIISQRLNEDEIHPCEPQRCGRVPYRHNPSAIMNTLKCLTQLSLSSPTQHLKKKSKSPFMNINEKLIAELIV